MDQTVATSMPAGQKLKPPIGDTVLSVRGVSKAFKIPAEKIQTLKERVIKPKRRGYLKFEALKDINFDVRAGEFLGIVGRNGSGKSTLLKCIAGVYQPSTGEIGASGRIATFIELGVGFNPELDAHDNVQLNATLLGLTAAQARAKFDEIIAFAELEEFVEMKLKNYSSGMQVRLAFSVAIQAEADILLIDEVLAVGDAAFQQKCFDVFHQLRADGKTVIFVTHSMPMIERFCSRAIMLERGQQVAEGKPNDVARAYTQMNFDRTAPVETVDDRHGDGDAEILECWFEDSTGDRTNIVGPADQLTAVTRVKFNSTMLNPVFGLAVRDDDGALAFYSDTRHTQLQTGTFEAGSEATFRLQIENYLGEGKYNVSPSIEHSEGARVAAAHGNIASFLSSGHRQTAGFADLPFKLSIDG